MASEPNEPQPAPEDLTVSRVAEALVHLLLLTTGLESSGDDFSADPEATVTLKKVVSILLLDKRRRIARGTQNAMRQLFGQVASLLGEYRADHEMTVSQLEQEASRVLDDDLTPAAVEALGVSHDDLVEEGGVVQVARQVVAAQFGVSPKTVFNRLKTEDQLTAAFDSSLFSTEALVATATRAVARVRAIPPGSLSRSFLANTLEAARLGGTEPLARLFRMFGGETSSIGGSAALHSLPEEEFEII